MIETTPQVYLVSEPFVDVRSMTAYLREVGGESWIDDHFTWAFGESEPPDCETLIEFAGRLCYKSWKPGLNKNVDRIRKDRGEYLLNILRAGHGSVLEHAHFTFVLHNVSRVFTAEWNRHRHANLSEQSLRYVRLNEDIPFRSPIGVLSPETIEEGRRLIEHIEKTIDKMYKLEGIDDEDSFFTKKTVTSAIRRYAPLGMSTEEVWTANIRDIRHVLEVRSSTHAEEEVRIVADQIGSIMVEKAPFLFQDYAVDNGEWTTENKKV